MWKLLILFFITFGSNHTLAINEIRLGAPYITSLIEEDGQGYYQRILKQALRGLPIQVYERFYPYKRALLLFERKEMDCIYSFTSVFQDKLGEDKIVYSYPLGAFAYYIFSPKGKPAVSSSQEIVGKRVGAVLGHDSYYMDKLNKDIRLSMVDEDKKNLRLLELKRIDYMIGALPDLTPHLDQLSYNPDKPLVQSFDRITCHANESNKRFLKALSQKLKPMNEQGKYEELGGYLYLKFTDSERY